MQKTKQFLIFKGKERYLGKPSKKRPKDLETQKSKFKSKHWH